MEEQPANGILEDFRIQLVDCWQRLPNKGLFFVLLVAWLSLFHFLGNSTLGYIPTASLLSWMRAAYASAGDAAARDDSHGKLIPFVVLALFWLKRKRLLALPLRTWTPGIAGGGAGTDAASAGVHGPATTHLDRRAVRRHLRFDGPGVGTPMAAGELLPVLPVRLLCAAGVVCGVHHLSPAAAGLSGGGADFGLYSAD